MTVYTFETIGAAQALTFNPGSDQLTFTTPGASASNITVGVDQNTGKISITSELTGRTVVFGSSLDDSRGTFTFGDGTRMVFGFSYPDPLQGSAGPDLMFGSNRSDQLSAGAGNDTLIGGSQQDQLTGGEGHDLFIIRLPPSNEPGFSDEAQTAPLDWILDWSADDRLSFGPTAGSAGNFAVLAANDYAAPAKTAADALIAKGAADFVVAPVGSNLYVFADSKQDNGAADSWVILKGSYLGGVVSLPTINANQIVATPATTFTASTQLEAPAAPARPGGLYASTIGGNMDAVQLKSLLGAEISRYESTVLSLHGPSGNADLTGTGFTYDNNAQLLGGTLTILSYYQPGAGSGFVQATIYVAGLSVASFGDWVATNANDTALRALFAGNQILYGGFRTDLIRGYGGDDVIYGDDSSTANGATFDSLFGGDGDDQIFANAYSTSSSPTYMRGETGNDYMVGGRGFDDMHGNQGQDTVIGGDGNDWVVGGQDNDKLYGQAGDDIVYGNLGDDTCVGGDGADIVRGGQNNDVLYGDAGNDWLSGDKGSDTLTGGAGADIFHTWGEAGLDRVLDFRTKEGDRVMLDVGTTYTVHQVGADTVIDMTGGGQMVLTGVNMADLTAGWIFFG